MSELPIIAIVVLAGFAAFAMLARRPKASPPSAAARLAANAAPAARPDAAGIGALPDHGGASAASAASAACLRLAFGVVHGDETLSGKHLRVLRSVAAALEQSVQERDYFPRRPLQLPKLLKTLNDSEATRRELAQLIAEDPALTSAVLQGANSPAYRVAPTPVENIDGAVLLLGTEGLRGLLATTILQPVFQVPRGYFDNFAAITWERAERSSAAAGKCTELVGSDAFVAQILALLKMLAHIVIFRLTMEKYREQPDTLPHAGVFIAAIELHRARMARLIASSWKLSPASLAALAEQESGLPPAQMGALGRITRVCSLSGALATLAAHGAQSHAEALALLQGQGLEHASALMLWQASSGLRQAH
ncbi:HDOD domain-containing protein [Rhodocyclus tenuis]|uniref:HD-like signal output (HDOD) protein n=1 Tax=Rhodocyclus tenuis TaxID=1066 RepID=A0A840GHC9_RHOTE|nr:HDOD domain-containing protein [Rhodocyclus tenuis]MBB4247589.1 HD-like signal output (HDOD) protein [Rhodocyclus tenuis]